MVNKYEHPAGRSNSSFNQINSREGFRIMEKKNAEETNLYIVIDPLNKKKRKERQVGW